MNKLKNILILILMTSMIFTPRLTVYATETPAKIITRTITTYPADGVKVTIRTSPYSYQVISAPATFNFMSGKSYSLTFEKVGYFPYTQTITADEHLASICVTLAPVGTPAYLIIMTKPSGAQVSLDKYPDDDVRHVYAYKNSTPCTINDLVVGQEYTVTITKKGYETETWQIKVQLEGTTLNLNLSLLPILNITSSPSGATVYINDKIQSNKTPCKIEGLKRGSPVYLKIEKSGYKTLFKTIMVENGITPLNFKMTPNPSIYLTTYPSGATVYVDGNKVVNMSPPYDKFTPCTLEGFEANTLHTIKVELSGYISVTKPVKVSSSKLPVYIVLQKLKDCTLNLKSSPSGALILIGGIPNDGSLHWADSFFAPFSTKVKPFEKITITAQKEGYISQTKTLDVQNGKTYNLILNLVKKH